MSPSNIIDFDDEDSVNNDDPQSIMAEWDTLISFENILSEWEALFAYEDALDEYIRGSFIFFNGELRKFPLY
jgi:hypothetical protein